jgi:uncharacterized protein YutE (UPF0331/DUF86 family)
MVIRAKVLEILQTLEEYVATLERLRRLPREQVVGDSVTQWAARYGLVCAIQCVLDASLHILVDAGFDRPHDNKEIIDALGRHAIVPEALAGRMRGMAGFRNILVHRYFKVDAQKVHEHLNAGLDDFVTFAKHVRNWLDQQP